MESVWENIEPFLDQVTRPGRYAGNEQHAIKKDWSQAAVSFALAFPDVYEIGMSHLGIGILYHVLNRHDWILCERVFSPWVDMESLMREKNIPLFSLESKQPVRRFDILGITLQYELQYSNVLNLIDLAGVPLWSRDRKRGDPFVIAGGPCAYNPEPLADFLDAVVLGDGEEAIVEIANVVRKAKQEQWSREIVMKEMAKLQGVYIPAFYRSEGESKGKMVPAKPGIPEKIRARILDQLSIKNYPFKPVVPLIQVVHDRFSLEIMRGCTRGCRFCNAGVIYRPVRERTKEDLLTETRAVISNTGYDEISLVSLSTSDYTELPDLMSSLWQCFDHQGVSISLPSLRPETFTEVVADLAQGLRRSGLTLAPEAGTQRLRNVINKNNSEENLIQAVTLAYEKGWKQVKLYFMIGLPTETREDMEGIVDLVQKVIRLGKKYGRKDVHVSISPFSPKPHTPFQWEAQDTVETMNEKIRFLRDRMRWKELKLSWRDPEISRLEAVLGRGDRRIGDVIYRAWKAGARFDAWSDQFHLDRWHRAFEESRLGMEEYTKNLEVDLPLPWEHLTKGVAKSFLLKERARAFAGDTTGDCRFENCQSCGLMQHPVCQSVQKKTVPLSVSVDTASKKHRYGRRTKRVPVNPVKKRIRFTFKKTTEVRFTSHLDTMRIFVRALRMAKIPVALSQGYHAHLKISMGPPLPLGYTSRAEYADIELADNLPRQFDELLNRSLPEGFEVSASRLFIRKTPSLNSAISLASYRIYGDGLEAFDSLDQQIQDFLKLNSYPIKREKKGSEVSVDIRPYVVSLEKNGKDLELLVKIGTDGGSVKADEVLQVLIPRNEVFPKEIYFERNGLFIEEKGFKRNPLEVLEEN